MWFEITFVIALSVNTIYVCMSTTWLYFKYHTDCTNSAFTYVYLTDDAMHGKRSKGSLFSKQKCKPMHWLQVI